MGEEVINTSLSVTDWHFQYLRLQKGKLDPLAHDRGRWHRAYENDLASTYREIRAHLPLVCLRILDVGSGLGGIDVLLYRHYAAARQLPPLIDLLDGLNDAPLMHKHATTFSNARCASDFLKLNGIPDEQILFADPAGVDNPVLREPRHDLVVSFGSWCFHYAPSVYLDRVLAATHRETVFILDVRRDKGEWTSQLLKHLREVASIRVANKYARGVYVQR